MLFLAFIYIYEFLSFQRATFHSTMSKTYLDADMDAEMEEMEKEEGYSDGEEEEAEGK